MPADAPAPADRVAAYLTEARERSERPLGPSAMALPITNDAVRALMASGADVPRLLAAVEAILELPAKWERFSTGHDAQAECADELRRVITRKLLTEEGSRG